MKFEFHEKIYTDIEDRRKFKKILKKIETRRHACNIYLLTEPIYPSAGKMLEIYHFPELMQPYYAKMNQRLIIYGISDTKHGIETSLCDLICDVEADEKYKNIKEFFDKKLTITG